MGYNDPQPQNQQVMVQDDQYGYGDPNQPGYGYQYPGDMWAGRPSNDQSAQVRQALFSIEKMPESADEWQSWFAMVSVLIDSIPRIPSSDSMMIDKINRKFKFLLNRANSQGCKGIMESKAMELLFLIRSQVSNGSVPVAGLTGVGAMITTHSNQKQEIRYPQQQVTTPGILDLIPRLRGH